MIGNFKIKHYFRDNFSEESKRNLMLAPANNQDLTPLNVVSSVTFTNFAFAVGLYILLLSIISFVISIIFNIFVISFVNI